MELTPADKYIASLYERFVDKGLHLAQIKDELAYKGIKRNLFQIAYDLDTRYGFCGYAASHPAPAVLTYAQLDAIEDVKTAKARKAVAFITRAGANDSIPASR